MVIFYTEKKIGIILVSLDRKFGSDRNPETGSLHSRSCGVKTGFDHIPSFEQSKRDVFITVISNIFNIFYGPSEKCKALYSVDCILVSIVNFIYLLCSMGKTGSFTHSRESLLSMRKCAMLASSRMRNEFLICDFAPRNLNEFVRS